MRRSFALLLCVLLLLPLCSCAPAPQAHPDFVASQAFDDASTPAPTPSPTPTPTVEVTPTMEPATPAPTEENIPAIAPAETPVTYDKVVALTFDDGPHAANTPRLLDALKKYDAHATFFIVADRAHLSPESLKRMAEEGHQLGTHTYSHTTLTSDDFSINNEIERSLDIINEYSGVRPKVLRPPEGKYTLDLIEKIGLPCIMWSIDPQDWKYRDAEVVSDHILENAQDGDIILLHDIRETSVDAAIIVLEEMTKKGYKFVTISELLGEMRTDVAYRSRDKIVTK